MAIIDYIFIGAVVIALVVGLVKGFLSTLIELGGLIAAIFVAGKFSTLVSGWMASLIVDDSVRNIVAYLVCFIVTIIVVSIIGKLLKRVVKSVKIFSVLDRLLGLVVSVGIVYVIFSIIVPLVATQSDVVFLSDILTLINGLIPDTSYVAQIYASNPVGEWLMALIFPA